MTWILPGYCPFELIHKVAHLVRQSCAEKLISLDITQNFPRCSLCATSAAPLDMVGGNSPIPSNWTRIYGVYSDFPGALAVTDVTTRVSTNGHGLVSCRGLGQEDQENLTTEDTEDTEGAYCWKACFTVGFTVVAAMLESSQPPPRAFTRRTDVTSRWP